MRSAWRHLPAIFIVMSLGIGVTMLSFVVAFVNFRDEYLGGEAIPWSTPAYFERFRVLITISGLTAAGFGFLAMSFATLMWRAIAANNAGLQDSSPEAEKEPSPEI